MMKKGQYKTQHRGLVPTQAELRMSQTAMIDVFILLRNDCQNSQKSCMHLYNRTASYFYIILLNFILSPISQIIRNCSVHVHVHHCILTSQAGQQQIC